MPHPSLTSSRSVRFWPPAAVAVLALGGCAEPSAPAPGGGTGGTAGTGASAEGVTLVPNATGWVDGAAEGNTIGVQGAWYPYGDQYGVAKCTSVGLHLPAECSIISTPDPLVEGFPNVEGAMCTTGETAVVLPCGPTVPGCTAGTPDYSNMWGAGIGLDLNAEGGDAGTKSVWNPDEHGVTGIAFEIDTVPAGGLRVEFPIVLPDMTTTEDHADGSPYWGAASNFPPSPVVTGRNELRWTAVLPPRTSYTFDRKQILAIQFHVPAVTSGTTRGAYSFCIKNLTFLTDG